jgi:hypothetical protein
LKAAGLTGLNFAFLETYQGYHTRLDTIENLDPRSVQHLGANVLGIVPHFGNLTLPQTTKPDVVYFNWFGSQLLVYPVWFAWMVALLAPILFALGCVRSAGRLELSLGRTVAGFGSFFLLFLIIIGGSFAAFSAARFIAGEFLEGDTTSNRLLLAGVVGTAFGLGIVSQRVGFSWVALTSCNGRLFSGWQVCSLVSASPDPPDPFANSLSWSQRSSSWFLSPTCFSLAFSSATLVSPRLRFF